MQLMYVLMLISYSFHFIGVLAAIWPCGIIVVLAELFRAESKSQVYAILHEFLYSHTGVLDDLSKFYYTKSP